MTDNRCQHFEVARFDVKPQAKGCVECLKIGASWVHLRRCLQCGHVGCCDSSPYRHATGHYHQTGHPVIQSFEPGEDWIWCYVHQIMGEPT